MRTIVILNEQHTLLQNQTEVIIEELGNFELFPVPANGWTLLEMKRIALDLIKQDGNIVFASPVPALMMKLSFMAGSNDDCDKIFLLHNDKREKVELPGGTIIFKVAKDGWQLVSA